MKTETNYMLPNRPDVITHVTVITQVNSMVTSIVKLDVELERKTLTIKWPRGVDATQIGSKSMPKHARPSKGNRREH